MKMQAVQSSQINAIGYAAATKTLQIEFKGGSLYEYANIPPDLFEAFAKAPSIGSFFYKNIKNDPVKYPYVKLEDNKAVDAPAPTQATEGSTSTVLNGMKEDADAAAETASAEALANAPTETLEEPAPTSGEDAPLEEQSGHAAAAGGNTQNQSNC